MPAPGFPAGLAPAAGLASLPFGDVAELYEILPEYLRNSPSEVSDALVGALLDVAIARSNAAIARAAQTDEADATGSNLDLLGVSNRNIPRQIGEIDADYSARLLGDVDVESPAALLAAVFAITAPFYPHASPYYWERSDDDPSVYADTGRNIVMPDGSISLPLTDGFYLTGAGPQVVNAARRYATRGVRAPYAMLWQGTTPPAIDAPGVWGAAVLAIPPFPQPGASTPEDLDAFAQGSQPLLDTNGNMVPWASTLLAYAATVPSAAHAADGRSVYTQASDTALVVGRVQGLLATRMAFPIVSSILLDPELT